MSEPTLVDELLADQQRLTAVERFSRAHDAHASPAQARHYRDLIPLTTPAAGEQYAFEVELDKCSGCKACVTACHNLNGLDDNETWREVGLLIPEPKRRRSAPSLVAIEFKQPALNPSLGTSTATTLQHVTTACHHCVDPGCLNGCPVLAYEKDPVTGIVRHLDDQCIGCQYCVLKCPYDVPKYNARLGIVRKCDMCSSRLAVGEAPACVQACPNEAIRITKVNTSTVTIEFRERGEKFLNGAPAGDYTLPTTRYVSRAAPPNPAPLIAADATTLLPQPAHWPLVVMLVLTQASVGVAIIAAVQSSAPRPLLLLALTLAVVGLGSSVLHLGRPLGAWRAFLNLRRSWMSREIVVFGMFPPLLAAALVMSELSARGTRSSPSPLNGERAGVRGGADTTREKFTTRNDAPTPHPGPAHERAASLQLAVGATRELPVPNRQHAGSDRNLNAAARFIGNAAVCIGLLGVFCSAMIYHDTHRPLWHLRRSLPLFFGTTLALGAAGAAIFHPSTTLFTVVILASSAKLLVEILAVRHITDRTLTPLKKTALLITGKFQHLALARLVALTLGGIGLPLVQAVHSFSPPLPVAALAFGVLLVGELLERCLYFTSVVAPKMPGGVSS